MTDNESALWVTTTEAAKILNTTPKAVRKLAAAGRLKRYRKALVKENLYLKSDVEALLRPKAD